MDPDDIEYTEYVVPARYDVLRDDGRLNTIRDFSLSDVVELGIELGGHLDYETSSLIRNASDALHSVISHAASLLNKIERGNITQIDYLTVQHLNQGIAAFQHNASKFVGMNETLLSVHYSLSRQLDNGAACQ